GVTVTFLSLIIGMISGTRQLASRDNITARSRRDDTRIFSASLSWIPRPIPIVAESSSFGMIPRSFWTEPRVSFTSTNGTTIKFGENERVAITLIFGTHVYTKSAPVRSAAIDDRI